MRTHPSIAIQQALRSYFPGAQLHPLDAQYATLTLDAWGKVHSAFVAHMWEQDLPEWLEQKGDCDDWAWLFRAYVIEHNWSQQASRVPVACFYLHYTMSDGTHHAINAVVIRDGEQLLVAPIEPQPEGGLITLTQAERESCTLIIG